MINTDKIKKVFFTKSFILFIIIGCINTLSSIIFSYIYSLAGDKFISFILGYATGIIISYVLNSFVTFKEQLSVSKFIKFFISCIPNYVIQTLTVIIGFEVFHLHKLIAYSMAALIGVPVTFLILRVFVFTKKSY